jgi:quercetin dioxygenase-like cupin family protein
MRRRSLTLLVGIVMLFGFVASQNLPRAVAQEGTPSGEPELPPGATAEFIAAAPLGALPANPDLIAMIRLTLEPGATFPADPNDPTGAFVIVESGTLTIRTEAPLTVSRATGPEEDFNMEPIASDTDVTLGPGDAVYVEPFQAPEARNDGDEQAVFLLVNILPSEEEGGATPNATPAA